MRYPAPEKAEIIALVEQSHLPAKRTLDKLGIPRAYDARTGRLLTLSGVIHLAVISGFWVKPLGANAIGSI